MQNESMTDRISLSIENVGGIDRTEVGISPGVTVLSGRNATNRTSFLQALMAACGSDEVSIKADAEEAHVELEIGEKAYTRTLTRNGTTVQFDGDPYLDDSTEADLFAFLLESNEARQAVARGDNLRNLIMRPIDTDEIQAELDRLREERKQLDRTLDEIDGRKEELPELEAERSNIRERLEEKQSELAHKEAEIEALDADLEESRSEKAELEDRLETIQEKRSTLEDVRYDLETERESLKELRAEEQDLRNELDDLPETPAGELDELESELDRLREQKRTLDSEINELQSTIRFNEEALEDAENDIGSVLEEPHSEESSITGQLLENETVTCWTCGSTVERDQIESTLDQLRELSRQKSAEVSEIEAEIDDLQTRRKTLQEKQRERERLEQRLRTVEDRIEDADQRVDHLETRRETLSADIESLDREVEEMETENYSEVLDIHRDANQLEYEIGQLESDLESVEDEIEQIEERLNDRDDLEAERDAIQSSIEDLRTKIERTENRAVEEFNAHMDDVLDLLNYGNLARVWLERVKREVRDGRRTVERSGFELHVVRQTESGTAYEDTVDHLSESEREVTGLIFALAGYLVHDVYERIPFMLLDSLEAIDSSRIATLVDYFEEYSPYLVVALLPEDADALDDDYDRITEI